MKHPEHICRFNDGEQTCECYDKGCSESRAKTCEEIIGLIDNIPQTVHAPYFKQDGCLSKTVVLSKIKSLSKENLIKEEKEI